MISKHQRTNCALSYPLMFAPGLGGTYVFYPTHSAVCVSVCLCSGELCFLAPAALLSAGSDGRWAEVWWLNTGIYLSKIKTIIRVFINIFTFPSLSPGTRFEGRSFGIDTLYMLQMVGFRCGVVVVVSATTVPASSLRK